MFCKGYHTHFFHLRSLAKAAAGDTSTAAGRSANKGLTPQKERDKFLHELLFSFLVSPCGVKIRKAFLSH